MNVLVAVAWPDRQEVIALVLAEGSTAADAIAAANLGERIDLAAYRLGIWSRPCGRDTLLREGDRVELYRSLQADPKQMRRTRARSQGKGR